MPDDLGPFQEHFETAIRHQFMEIRQHLADSDRVGAADEAIDIICIGLNVLRWLDYEPSNIATIARSRAELRMRGQTLRILDKYDRLYKPPEE